MENSQRTLAYNVSDWTVLVVDDTPDNTTLLKFILARQGATVHTAVDGESGLTVLEQVTPSLILLDILMPGMDGWSMLNAIRANSRLDHVPVVAVTAYAMQGDRERVLAAGFDGYIAKPFDIMTLVEDIRRSVVDFAETTR